MVKSWPEVLGTECSHTPLGQAWPAYPCSEDPTPHFYASFWKLPAACAISRRSDWGVSATLGSELGSSGFLGLLLDGLCLEAATPPLGSHHPREKILFFFSSQMSSFISCLFFRHCLTPLFWWLCSPHCLLLLVHANQALEHLLHPPHLYQFSHSPTSSFHPSLPLPASSCCSRQPLNTLPFSLRL